MKTLTAMGVSFRDDPKALGLLLLGILETTRRNDGRISASEIATIARDLGYRGPLPAVFALLLAQGFLSREDGWYSITETNGAAIRQFNLEHEGLFAFPCLSEGEKALLFESMGVNGSGPERLALRVIRLLTDLNQELSLVSVLRLRNWESISQNEAALVIGVDRSKWLFETTDRALTHADSLQDGDISEFASALGYASDLHERACSVMDRQAENEELLHRLARDEEILVLMDQIRVFLRSFNAVILKAESSGK